MSRLTCVLGNLSRQGFSRHSPKGWAQAWKLKYCLNMYWQEPQS